MMNKEEIIDIIQLINSENVGPITFYKLMDMYGSPKLAIENIYRHRKLVLFSRRKAEEEYLKAKAIGVSLISFNDEFYPNGLKNLDDAPPLIYVLGNTNLLKHDFSLSIVGARNASINGRKTASRIAFELTNNDVLIVSGMASGIDSAAHKGALYAKEQSGPTIAVLGTGVDVVYPQQNQALYEQILNQGAISEFPLGTQPQASNFPRRNRIVSALGMGTLVVEATLHSGSLITAKMSLEQGKDIFAIPGSPNDARAAGPNKLIKDGAILVENMDDILTHLAMENNKTINRLPKASKKAVTPLFDNIKVSEVNKSEISILDYLDYEGIYVDEIIRESGLSASEVAAYLLDLELEGRIERLSGNKVALIK